MAIASSSIPNTIQCPKNLPNLPKHRLLRPSTLLSHTPFSTIGLPRLYAVNKRVVYASASFAAGSSSSDNDFNPYEVIGVNAVQGFGKLRDAYAKKRKDAERSGDEATIARLDQAYDKIMFQQLSDVISGSFKVSKDIKYADKLPIIPWGPRFSKSDAKDILINMAISAAFTVWVFVKPLADYKPLEFLALAFVYRIFEKLKAAEPYVAPSYNELGEDEGKMRRAGKRTLRSLSLVFGCIAFASLGYTGVLNILEFTAGYVPVFLYNNQELLVTGSTAFMLLILASFYR